MYTRCPLFYLMFCVRSRGFTVYMFSLLLGSHKIGIGFVDATSRELSLAEFEDNEVFSNLESAIIQLGVKECLLLKPVSVKLNLCL